MTILDAFQRLDLLVPLVAGHLLADFVLQTDRMVARKERWGVLLGHVSVVAVTSWILIGPSAASIPLVLVVALLHLLVDLGKGAIERRAFGDEPADASDPRAPGFWSRNGPSILFLGDQAVHALTLVAVVASVGRVPFSADLPPDASVWTVALGTSYLRFLVLLSGLIVATTGVGYFFGHFLARFEGELEPDQRGGLSKGGYWIGVTERSLIFLFILVGEPAGIGFLAAAKSVFRIGELKDAEDRKLAEYILIGTLLSFAAAMVVGLVTRAVLGAVR